MAIRTKCLYQDKIIGIESIYTAINGKQINIPDKVERLRELGRRELLFCPCGCGANLILVAGDKNLKEQHFRIKHSDEKEYDCKVNYEGEESLKSKIILKCWLEDKLKKSDLLCEVPAYQVDDTDRKYEYTVYDSDNKVGIGYWRYRANITDKKISILNTNATKVIYIVGDNNEGSTGQYPEFMMKVQKSQGFNLYLSVNDDGLYDSSILFVSYFVKDIDGEWNELDIAEDYISLFDISNSGRLSYNGTDIDILVQKSLNDFNAEQEIIKQARIIDAQEKVKRAEEERLERERIAAQREAERIRRQKEWEERQEQIRIENEKRQEELKKQAEEKKRQEELAKVEEEKKRQRFEAEIEILMDQQETQVRDPDGNRWIKCEICGKIATDEAFSSYGGPNHINLGVCKECEKKGLRKSVIISMPVREPKKKIDKNTCPDCGKKLVERNGRNGRFIGCTGFPNCRYSRSKW